MFKIYISVLVFYCIGGSYGNVAPVTAVEKDAIETHPNVNLLPESCGDVLNDRLISRDTAQLYEFPWMALISYQTRGGSQFQCSGTIVNSKYILTAGHCVFNNKKIIGVRIGEFDLRYRNDCQGEEPQVVCESHFQDIQVEDIILHENFSGSPPQDDVALIRLKKPIDFNYKNALPICLPVTQKLRNAPLAGTTGIGAGWGLILADIYSPVLLKLYTVIKTDEECRNLVYNRNETEKPLKEICTGEYHKDSCIGDSGGPLIVEGVYKENIRYIQYGIVSRGPKYCGSGPGIYTDVTKFMKWILDNIKE